MAGERIKLRVPGAAQPVAVTIRDNMGWDNWSAEGELKIGPPWSDVPVQVEVVEGPCLGQTATAMVTAENGRLLVRGTKAFHW
jgi:hypothetical protein